MSEFQVQEPIYVCLEQEPVSIGPLQEPLSVSQGQKKTKPVGPVQEALLASPQ